MFNAFTHCYPRHVHERYAIGLMLRGGSHCLTSSFDEYLVGPGDIALLHPGRVHTGTPVEQSVPSYIMFYMETAHMQAAAQEFMQNSTADVVFPRMVVSRPDVKQTLMRLYRAVRFKEDRLVKQSVEAQAMEALFDCAALSPKHSQFDNEPRAIKLVREYLHDHIGEHVTLEDLSEMVGLSRHHLLRVFSKNTGVSPHQYHVQLRIEHARRLFQRGLSIADVAYETGFVDQSHFTKAFKKVIGVTPGQYLSY